MIGGLLPPGVAACEVFADPPEAVLFAEEEAAVARAVPARRREFATVRLCARRALSELGYPAVAILPGPGRAPCWPEGVVGSLTHCDGYRAGAVALRRDLAAVGIDAEPHQPLPAEVREVVASPAERARLAELSAEAPAVAWDRLLFSAKESVYKAWFPLTGRWLDFTEAAVEFSADSADAAVRSGAFTARLLIPGPVVSGQPLTRFHGRWLVRGGLVLTSVTVPPSAR